MTPAGVRRERDGGTGGGSPAGDVGRASTSPKVLTSIGTVLATLLVSRPHSTADRGRLSVGELHPKPSTNCYSPTSEDVLRRPLETGQYLSIRYTERLTVAGLESSVGSVGDSYDNALAEPVIGLLQRNRSPPSIHASGRRGCPDLAAPKAARIGCCRGCVTSFRGRSPRATSSTRPSSAAPCLW